MGLLMSIARCPNVPLCLDGKVQDHPCAQIIGIQRVSSLDDFQVPEPWNGDLRRAPILFVSSNPSISYTEDYPRWAWLDYLVHDFFTNRFGGGHKAWVKDGNRALQRDGNYDPANKFWSSVRERAAELLVREPVPGLDYALTEVVHCKSRSERGVSKAMGECSRRWLPEVLKASAARVLVVLGMKARPIMREMYNLAVDQRLVGPLQISGRERVVVFLPHPNARMLRTFKTVLMANELRQVQAFVRG